MRGDPRHLDLRDVEIATEDAASIVVRRGIDTPPREAFVEILPTAADLMELPLDQRIAVIWASGVRPLTPDLVKVFETCAEEPGRGFFIGMSTQTGEPPWRKFHQGEARYDLLVWPDGYPRTRAKRVVSEMLKQGVKRQRPSTAGNTLWASLACGCLDACVGAALHAAEADRRRRQEAELIQQQLQLAEVLSSATLRR